MKKFSGIFNYLWIYCKIGSSSVLRVQLTSQFSAISRQKFMFTFLVYNYISRWHGSSFLVKTFNEFQKVLIWIDCPLTCANKSNRSRLEHELGSFLKHGLLFIDAIFGLSVHGSNALKITKTDSSQSRSTCCSFLTTVVWSSVCRKSLCPPVVIAVSADAALDAVQSFDGDEVNRTSLQKVGLCDQRKATSEWTSTK